MNNWFNVCVCTALALLAFASSASAQENHPGETSIDTKPKVKRKADLEKDEKLELDVHLTSEFHASENLDMRPLDESSQTDQLETDDRQNFAYSSLAGEVFYEVREDTTFELGGSLSGLWGSDQLGSTNEFGSVLYLYRLNVNWNALNSDSLDVSTRIGRQPFEIGGAGDSDFFFDDIVDGATLNLDFGGEAGKIRLLGDLYASNSRPEDIDFADYLGGDETHLNFRGDTNTFRGGGVYENTSLLDEQLDVRAFGFYAEVGAGGTGYDRSYRGSLGNVTDDDSVWMAGTRIGYTYANSGFELRAFGEYARSGGQDRKDKQVGLFDVENSGNAFGGGLRAEKAFNPVQLSLKLRYFRADGAKYASSNGAKFSHGFVSFKGAEAGGLNMDRYAGWHPSAYLGQKGVNDNPQNLERQSGTQTMHAKVGVGFAQDYQLQVSAWRYRDTSTSNFDQSRVDEVSDDLPYGYSRADLDAQQRLGQVLGHEFNLAFDAQVNDVLALYGIGGLFLPGEYYETEIDRTAGTALGAPNGDPSKLKNFWALGAGTKLSF